MTSLFNDEFVECFLVDSILEVVRVGRNMDQILCINALKKGSKRVIFVHLILDICCSTQSCILFLKAI